MHPIRNDPFLFFFLVEDIVFVICFSDSLFVIVLLSVKPSVSAPTNKNIGVTKKFLQKLNNRQLCMSIGHLGLELKHRVCVCIIPHEKRNKMAISHSGPDTCVSFFVCLASSGLLRRFLKF